MMNVGSIVFEPAPVFMKQVDHSIFFTPPPLALAQVEEPMQLYCYVKQLDDVRAFMTKLGICKHVTPLSSGSAMELHRRLLRGQVFVHFPDHVETCHALAGRALIEGMFVMEIQVGEGN